MRFGILKENNFHLISVRTSLPCLSVLAGAWIAGMLVLPSKSLNCSPAASSPFCCLMVMLTHPSSLGQRVTLVPEYCHRHEGTRTFELCLLGFISCFLNLNWDAVLGIFNKFKPLPMRLQQPGKRKKKLCSYLQAGFFFLQLLKCRHEWRHQAWI